MSLREKREVLDSLPDEVILELGVPKIHWYRKGRELQALCPFHDDKTLGSFGYNVSKHLWRCFVCGAGGKGPISLVMRVNNLPYGRAIDLLYANRNMPIAGIGGQAPVFLTSKHSSLPSPAPLTPPPGFSLEASAQDLDLIYSCFAAASPLSPSAAHQLCIKRGLMSQSSDSFFCFPSPYDESFMDRFRNMLAQKDAAAGEERLYHKLLGAPGFYWSIKDKCVRFIGQEGAIGILNHDVYGRINGIELRLKDSERGGTRYIPFSSSGIVFRDPSQFAWGTNLGAIVDVVEPAFKDKPSLGIAITEGKFKALHLSYLGYRVLNIHGISNWAKVMPILDELKALGRMSEEIFLAFDADSRTNLPVAEHTAAAGIALLDAGYGVSYLTWPVSYGKGIDDLIIAGKKQYLQTIPAKEYIQTVLEPFINAAKVSFLKSRTSTAPA